MMGRRRSVVVDVFDFGMFGYAIIAYVLISMARLSTELTNPVDVAAMNDLYVSLGYPILFKWIGAAGDPCDENWEGIRCKGSMINSIILNGSNLGGELGKKLGTLNSIKIIDFSNNHIGGSIPSSLPISLQYFFLSDNQFTGSIPIFISSLTQLLNMSLNSNYLTGDIPDAFGALTGLTNLDLSSNNLSGKLPPSVESLSSLATMHLQNNHLSGTLDVLQALPLSDLNVENNQFSGFIPEKLLSIPNFKKNGNSLNSTIAPTPSTLLPNLPPSPLIGAPHSVQKPKKQGNQPSASNEGGSGKSKKILNRKKIVWISIAGLLLFVILALALLLLCPRRSRQRQHKSTFPHMASRSSINKEPSVHPGNEVEKFGRPSNDINRLDEICLPPPSLPSPVKKIGSDSISHTNPAASVKVFTIPTLQQYTDSFCQENFIGAGRLGNVYRAQLPDGKLLAVKKLDMGVCRSQNDNEFLEMVNRIYKIQHENVVSLMGYCAEHGQRLLIYKYCGKGSLQDLLLSDDEAKKQLSWDARVQIALGAATALWYLHEVCNPAVVHRNFKTANVLLDDNLSACVSDSGFASLFSLASASQLWDHILSPEFEFGVYTQKGDVYSFGVVMLELLTGRKSYDGKRVRGEQFLVNWAIPQLHDIDSLLKMVDPWLGGDFGAKSLSRFADIISRCVQPDPEFRPLMSQVVQDLKKMVEGGSITINDANF